MIIATSAIMIWPFMLLVTVSFYSLTSSPSSSSSSWASCEFPRTSTSAVLLLLQLLG